MTILVPPIKCQGIKTKIFPYIKEKVNFNYDIWYEPFMGSGVIGFNIMPKKAIFSDTNPYLINFYNDLKNKKIDYIISKDYLYNEGNKLEKVGTEHYIEIRNRFNKNHNSLDFLFLNRSCFNGMIRFNKKGDFNVPFCKKKKRFSKSYITKITNQIKKIQNIIINNDYNFINCSFKDIIKKASYNDLIYCDPPYIDRNNDYYNTWNDNDEFTLFNELNITKSKFILSTWNYNKYRKNVYIDKLWKKFNIKNVEHFYFLGGKEINRNNIIESLITNF